MTSSMAGNSIEYGWKWHRVWLEMASSMVGNSIEYGWKLHRVCIVGNGIDYGGNEIDCYKRHRPFMKGKLASPSEKMRFFL